MANENMSANGTNSKNKGENAGVSEGREASRPIREVHHHYHYGQGFNFGKLFFGLLVIFFGLYYLARNTGWLPVDLQINWILIWPILIIFAGLSLLTGRSWLTAIIGIITTLIVVVAVVLMLFGGQIGGGRTVWPYWQMGVNNNFDDSQSQIKEQPIVIPRDEAAKSAVITLKARTGNVSVKGGSTGLVEGKYSASFGNVATSSNLDGASQFATLETFGPGPMMMFGGSPSDLDLVMTTQIPLRLNVSTGASSLELDLTRLVLEQLDIEAGASSLKLALGDKAALNEVKVKAGASSVEVEVPRTAGVKLVLDSALGSLNLEGFERIDDRNFKTSNYDRSEKKINLNFELGVSSLMVILK
jgi:hypothetical protein